MIMYCVRESCSRSGERKVLIDLQVVYSQYTVHVFISQVRLYPQYDTCIYFTSKIVPSVWYMYLFHKGYESTLSIWYAQYIVWLYDLECVLDCTKDMRVRSVYCMVVRSRVCSRLHKGYESTLSILYGCMI